MLTILFYIYATITAMVVSAMLVTSSQAFLHNKTTATVVASMTPEKIQYWNNVTRPSLKSDWNKLNKSQKIFASILLFIIGVFLTFVMCFVWWTVKPKMRFSILKDCLANNYVVIQ